MLFDSLTTATGVILKTKGTISFYWAGAFWVQTSVSNAMPELTTSGNITTTGTGSISTTGTGDIQSAGKVKTAVLDAVSDTIAGTTALKIGSNILLGDIEIGNAQTTGDIKIGLSDTSGATITVGTSSTATTINGTLTTSLGTIAGKNASIEYAVGTLPQTLDLTVSNLDIFVNLQGGTATGSLIIPNTTTSGQKITVKNSSTASLTIAFTTLLISLFGASGPGASSVVLLSGYTISFQYVSVPGRWFQIAPNDNFPAGLSAGGLTSSGLVTANGGFTMGGANHITLQTSTGTIPVLNQLGYAIVKGPSTTTVTNTLTA
jgi:hypothetical protein